MKSAARLPIALLALFYSPCVPTELRAEEEIPLTDRPKDLQEGINFFQAWGRNVRVAWSVDRRTVPEDGELTATLTIAIVDARNPQRIVRPNLKKLREFETRFLITDRNDPATRDDASEVKFSYLLQPRNRAVDEVPALEFYYYNSTAPVRSQFKLAIAARVPITVTAAPKREPPAIPLQEPDWLFATAQGPQVLEKPASIAGFWPWVIVGLAGPLGAALWFLAWQRIYPDAGRLARMRKSRAARKALEAIRQAGRASDPPAAIAAAVLGYLRTQFPLPPGAVTPGEIETALHEHAGGDCQAIASFFRAADAARFASSSDHGISLVSLAEELINRLEGA